MAAIRSVAAGHTYVSPTIVTQMVDTFVRRSEPIPDDPYDTLSDREREILLLAAMGHTSRDIARSLHLSEQTVHYHRANMMEKLGLRDRVDLLRYSVRRGLLSAEHAVTADGAPAGLLGERPAADPPRRARRRRGDRRRGGRAVGRAHRGGVDGLVAVHHVRPRPCLQPPRLGGQRAVLRRLLDLRRVPRAPGGSRSTPNPHAGVACESCHGALAEHAEASPVPGSAALALAEPTNADCLRCHTAADGKPVSLKTINPFQHYKPVCLECHDPHTTDATRPPVVRHPLDDLPPCVTCHGPDGFKARNQRHPDATTDDAACLECHAPNRGPARDDD